MAIHTNADSKLFISPTSVDVNVINGMSLEDALEFFEDISDWIEVEELEDLGELGDSSEQITFTAVNNSRVRKLKGPRDAGTQAIVVGRDPLDDGQEAFIAAEKTKFDFPIKIELADARSQDYTNSTLFYAGMVQGAPTNLGNVSNVVRRTFTTGINTAVYEVVSGATVAPVNTVLPSLIGAAVQTGVPLTPNPGVWTGNPTFTFTLQADDAGDGVFADTLITGTTLVPAAGTVGDSLRLKVVAVNSEGTPVTAYSLPTAPQIAA